MLALLSILALWTVSSRSVGTDALPGPAAAFAKFGDLVASGTAFGPLATTLGRSALGFALAVVTGTAYGILVVRYRRFERATSSLFNIALFAPTLVVILGGVLMLGRNRLYSIVLISGFLTFPSVGVYMRDALRDLDQDLLLMADSFKVSPLARVRNIYVPWLIPALLGASRIGFSIASKVVTLVELFGFPGGIGFRIINAYASFNIATLLAWLMLFVIALLVIEQGIRVLERKVIRWE